MTDHDLHRRLQHVEASIALATAKLAALEGERDSLLTGLCDVDGLSDKRPLAGVAQGVGAPLGDSYARQLPWGATR